MRFDLISIFPQFFNVLDLSLMGKAKESGAVQIFAHDLRQWTTDPHRTVDDTPYGGGAGMVMRADVWGNALDDVLRKGSSADLPIAMSKDAQTSDRCATWPRPDQKLERVLAVPTPSGVPLTQKDVNRLANADQIVVACGRYEGIDQRVVDHYRARSDVQVFEYSIGDYVLNGGEVAAIVLVEAVARLREGFMGNPASLEEESFAGDVVEYPAYTRPTIWRGMEVPSVLLSGNHARIESWRRTKSLSKTARVRPDLIDRTDPRSLSKTDREVLAGLGWIAKPGQSTWSRVEIRLAQREDVDEIARVAAVTFPDACPPYVTKQAQEHHVLENLSPQAVCSWITRPDHRVLVAQVDGVIEAYSLVVIFQEGEWPSDVPAHAVSPAPTYISKLYTTRPWRGTGLAGALLEAAIDDASRLAKGTQLVLGTARDNRRARKFYRRHGFVKAGQRVFMVADIENIDVLMTRPI